MLKNISVEKISEFEEEFLHHIEIEHPEVYKELRETGTLSDNVAKILEQVANEVAKTIK